MRKIERTSADKVNGKFVKYRQGDCLSIDCGDGRYLAVLVSDKFNKYYDLTLILYYDLQKPVLKDFVEGKFFGTRFGSWDEVTYAIDVRMVECRYIDNCSDIVKVDSVNLSNRFINAGYGYLKDVQQLKQYYLEELPIRIEKTKNAEKFPDLAFVSKHLVDLRHIIF